MYKLIIKSNNQTYTIGWNLPNEKKPATEINLYDIDYFVSKYKNSYNLISALNLKGIIPVTSGWAHIKEKANEKEYDVKVIFDSKFVHNVSSRVNKGNIDVVDFPEYTEFCTEFKEKLMDNSFFEKYVNKKTLFSQDLINNFYQLANFKSIDGTYEEEYERKRLNENINSQLKRYPIFRTVFLIMEQYKKDIINKEKAKIEAEKNKSLSEKSIISRKTKLTLGSIMYDDLADLTRIYNLSYEEDLTPEEYQAAFGYELIDTEVKQVLKK